MEMNRNGNGNGKEVDCQPNSTIFRTTTLATLPFSPFGSSLKWSNDGQALIITRTYLYLLTPSFQTTPGTSSDPQKPSEFSKTVIELDKHFGLPWSTHSNDLAAITPSSVDRFWRKAIWSPSALTTLGSCLLVGLTTNCDVYVFTPTKNFETGLWKNPNQINLSEQLLIYHFKKTGCEPESISSQSNEASAKRTRFTSSVLRTQTISLDWSSAIDLYNGDLSLLALGHRRGDISLWQHKGKASMELVCFEPICSNSFPLTELCWSNWRISNSTKGVPIEYMAYLAVANSKGVVYLTRVSRQLQSSNSVQIHSQLLYRDVGNKSTISAMQWSEPAHDPQSLALILTRLGEVVVCQIPEKGSPSLKVCELPSPDPRLDWASITNWAPCTGLSTIPIFEQTSIIITLFNGLVYVLDYNHSNHQLACDLQRSFQLSLDLRFKFRKIVGPAVTKQEVMSVYGSQVIGNGRLFSWVFEVDAPNRFRYKPENRQHLLFCIAPLGGCDPADELADLLETPKPCFRIAPLACLLPALLSLESPSTRLLELLNVDTCARSETKTLSKRNPIRIDLFENPLIDGLRIKANMCSYLIHRFHINSSSNPSGLSVQVCATIVDSYVKIRRRIYSEVIQIIAKFFEELSDDQLSEREKMMARRYKSARDVIGNRPEPTLPQLLAPDVPSHRLSDADRLEGTILALHEDCPACGKKIGFENLLIGTCEAGHVWDRCVISFEVLDHSQLRVCGGCGRKVGLRLGSLEEIVDGRCCLYCGNRWKIN